MEDNILKNIDTKNIPILGNSASKKDQRKEKMRGILQKPENHAALSNLAGELEKNFNDKVKLMVEMRVGAKVKDMLTNKVYVYEYFVTPITPDVKVEVILELAKRPLAELPDHMMVFFEEGLGDYAPRHTIATLDFCKLVACQAWVIIDMNVSEEKQFLKDIDKA